MRLNSGNIFCLTLGSVVGLLAILSASFAASLIGYFVLTLALTIAFVVTVHEGRPLYLVREGIKVFVGLGLIVWVLAVLAAAVLAVFA